MCISSYQLTHVIKSDDWGKLHFLSSCCVTLPWMRPAVGGESFQHPLRMGHRGLGQLLPMTRQAGRAGRSHLYSLSRGRGTRNASVLGQGRAEIRFGGKASPRGIEGKRTHRAADSSLDPTNMGETNIYTMCPRERPVSGRRGSLAMHHVLTARGTVPPGG